MTIFPMEIVGDVLSRLPVKTLFCFRCVSKSWCSLIDSTHFIKLHLKQQSINPNNLTIIVNKLSGDGSCYSVGFDGVDESASTVAELNKLFKNRRGGIDVWGSCNGLLFVSRLPASSDEEIGLWNPSTQKHHLLPKCPINRSVDHLQWYNDYGFVYGLGYDHTTDDYKVVRITQFHRIGTDSFENEVKVYSLKNNSWTGSRDLPYYIWQRSPGGLANGALHWMVYPKPMSDTSNFIIALDLAFGEEEYRILQQPDSLPREYHTNLGILGGCLCVLSNYEKVCVDVWVMKDYGVKESWMKLFSVAQPQVIASFNYIVPLAYSKSGRQVLLLQDGKMLIWYDLEKMSIKSVCHRGSLIARGTMFGAHISLESLVSPLNVGSGASIKKQQVQEKKKNNKKRDDFLAKGFKLVL